MIAPRFIELKRILKSAGSIYYLHYAPTASHEPEGAGAFMPLNPAPYIPTMAPSASPSHLSR
jgi:hypothetical protein